MLLAIRNESHVILKDFSKISLVAVGSVAFGFLFTSAAAHKKIFGS
ncbi:hypothetical protein DSUL_20511 [Desulfovibrionales bacterium]